MTQNAAPPIFVGVIGAWIGLQFPKLVVGVACLLVMIKIGPVIKEQMSPYYESAVSKKETVYSSILSKWYRVRIRIVIALRRVGLARVSDWIFGSETKR